MYHLMPDPCPGRCETFRNKMHSDGYLETLRCIGEEGTAHVCEFPEPAHVVHHGVGSWTSADQRLGKPWVDPRKTLPVEHSTSEPVLKRTGWGMVASA